MANGKRYDNAVKTFDREATFTPNEAVAMLQGGIGGGRSPTVREQGPIVQSVSVGVSGSH